MEHRDNRFPHADEVVVPRILRRRAREHPKRPFAVFNDGEEWSYAETAERVWGRANAFIELGIKPGDTVASWLPPGRAALETWFGLNAAGATYAPLNTAYKGSILEHTLNLSRAKVLIAHADLVERLEGLDLPNLDTVVVVGGHPQAPDAFGSARWDDLDTSNVDVPPTVDAVEVWDTMLLIYTSGTTGVSKAVELPYLQHYTHSFGTIPPEIDAEDRFFGFLPVFHASGTVSTYTMLQRGASIAILPKFSTSSLLDDARRLGVTCAILMAAMVNFMVNEPARPDDADNPIRIASTGPMPRDIEGFTKRFGIEIYSLYGTTELPSPLRTPLNPADPDSCGRPVDPEHYEVRIVDEHDGEVPPGVTGELIVRHSRPWSLFTGYRSMPEATGRAWRNGWYHTGDAFYRDFDDNFFFVDRLTDSLRRRGENISSGEVEAELISHPDVLQAACVAVESEHLEDEVKACLVVKDPDAFSLVGFVKYLEERLPYFMVPRYFEFLESLPMTPSMKIQKYLLRERGINEETWDREAAGLRLRMERLTEA